MSSGRRETPMPDLMASLVVDVGYCPKCRYALTTHDFACDAIGRLTLTHRCTGKPEVPCRYVPSGYEETGHNGYEIRRAKGCYQRTPPPPCAAGCGKLASSKKAKYCRACRQKASRTAGHTATARLYRWTKQVVTGV